jgi:hypothetical protein
VHRCIIDPVPRFADHLVMPDKRSHRGPHPEDARLFAPDQWPALAHAVHDVSWLLSRDYSLNAAVKLAGDHYQLADRQRIAVMRCACSDASLAGRAAKEVAPAQLAGHPLHIDGYNVLTTIEAALGGGILVAGRDGCLRDMASMHGHYKRVAETHPALEFIGQTLASLAVSSAEFYLDAPVSNSGRLKTIMRQFSASRAWTWTIHLVPDPDPVLARSPEIIATADSVILDGPRGPPILSAAAPAAPRWFNLTARIIAAHVPGATIVPLALPGSPGPRGALQ